MLADGLLAVGSAAVEAGEGRVHLRAQVAPIHAPTPDAGIIGSRRACGVYARRERFIDHRAP